MLRRTAASSASCSALASAEIFRARSSRRSARSASVSTERLLGTALSVIFVLGGKSVEFRAIFLRAISVFADVGGVSAVHHVGHGASAEGRGRAISALQML